jgi:hypothetical protein
VDRGPAAAQQPAAATTPRHDPVQELQVRQTAQRLLADHLRRPPNTSGEDAQHRRPSPDEAFWPAVSLDLTGAALVDFNFARVSVIQARFAKATFRGDAEFGGATFQGDAEFDEATFASGNEGEAFPGAQVLYLDDPDANMYRHWPDRYTVRPDPADPTRGMLDYAEQAEEPDPAVLPPDPTG